MNNKKCEQCLNPMQKGICSCKSMTSKQTLEKKWRSFIDTYAEDDMYFDNSAPIGCKMAEACIVAFTTQELAQTNSDMLKELVTNSPIMDIDGQDYVCIKLHTQDDPLQPNPE